MGYPAVLCGRPQPQIEDAMINGSIPEGLTFDDVLLLPGKSAVLPADTDTRTCFTRKLPLNIPLASSAMDTVTESRLAIAIARQGGIGIVHKNMPIDRQGEEVDRVKRSESGMIVDPVTISPDITLRQALEIMNKYKISGLPVTRGTRLTGILTNRDLRFEKNHNQLVSSVMTKDPLVTVPVGAAIGAAGDFLERAVEMAKYKTDVIAIDTAHGHSARVMDAIKAIRHRLPDVQLIAGNVATYDGAKDLIALGIDGLKVGMGPGSICTTRVVTGAGVPQITAIMEAARATEGTGIPIIADGGIKFSGDITKAIAAGASCVMIGSLFAGTEEAPGETILYQGRTFKSYRGMGSSAAMEEGSADRYSQEDEVQRGKSVPEGVEGRVPYKGSLAALTDQLVGGLRSGMGYVGAENLKALTQRSKFVRITSAGLRESHVHDVIITREAPNYRIE